MGRYSVGVFSMTRGVMDLELVVIAIFLLNLMSVNGTTGSVNGTVYHVGGETGWSIDSDVQAWLEGKNFTVGDTLVFAYDSSEYDVRQVSQLVYINCNPAEPFKAYNDGFTVITFTEGGTFFFVDGNRCMDLRLAVKVLPKP